MNDEQSDWLRARLRAADPARHLSDPRNLELTETAMTTTPSPAGPNRTRLALVAAAAAVLVLAGVGLAAGLGGDDEPSTTATGTGPDTTPSAPSSPDGATTATYTLDPSGQAAGRCIPPSAERLRELDVAFEGVVAERTDDRVVLDVQRTWKAPQEQSRVVLDVTRAEGAISEALPVSFEVGQEYVVGVKQGHVRLCGWTAESSPMLGAEYDEAFPGQR